RCSARLRLSTTPSRARGRPASMSAGVNNDDEAEGGGRNSTTEPTATEGATALLFRFVILSDELPLAHHRPRFPAAAASGEEAPGRHQHGGLLTQPLCGCGCGCGCGDTHLVHTQSPAAAASRLTAVFRCCGWGWWYRRATCRCSSILSAPSSSSSK